MRSCRDQEWQTPSETSSYNLRKNTDTKFERYEYVKTFERPDTLLPNTWIVVRIDGRGFHKSVLFLSTSVPPEQEQKRCSEKYACLRPDNLKGCPQNTVSKSPMIVEPWIS